MTSYRLHTLDSAPIDSKHTFEALRSAWGFMPNLGAVLAESPAALELVFQAFATLTSKGSLSAAEQQLVALTASRENQCHYCVAAHSTLALHAKLPAGALEAAREDRPIGDAKLELLRLTTQKLMQQRGELSELDETRFFEAGFNRAQLLELVGWIALKTLTTYTNRLAGTPVDEAWRAQAWSARAA